MRRGLWSACLVLGLMAAATTTQDADAGSRARRPVRIAQAGATPKRTSVASLIQKARGLFEDQAYEESIQILSGVVLRSDASKDERVLAYQILAFNHIALGRNEEADAAVRAIFVLDESFKLPDTESPRFREFFEKTRKAWEAEGKPGKIIDGAGTARNVLVKHQAPAQIDAGTELKVEGTIDDPDVRVEKVTLYYRGGGNAKDKFIELSLAYSMGAFRGVIPSASVVAPVVEYYVLALDKDGLPIAARGDADSPIRVVVPEGTKVIESPWFWVPIGVAVVGTAVLAGVLATQLGTESTIKINVTE
ncbi:MAG: hypothetical protein U0271_41380 [Polyangiaceae bacterium]